MDDAMKKLRIKRLGEALATARFDGNKSAMAREGHYQQSYISDLLNGKKSFGEKTARSLEKRLGLVPRSLDDPEKTQQKVAEAVPKYADLTIPARIAFRVESLDEGVQMSILHMIEAFNGQLIERRGKRRAASK